LGQSHLRHDKTCLNCGAEVPERYCTRCGQENTEPVETFGHLIGHFFSDVTHYDSQLLITLKDLITKPGFLTREYNAGKRASYLNPIRMYVFVSAVFFLVLFTGSKPENGIKVEPAKPSAAPKPKEESILLSFSSEATVVLTIAENKYATEREYDSIQRILPDTAKDGAFSRLIVRKIIRLKKAHQSTGEVVVTQSFEHNIPKVMFVLLPLFAAFVGLFYSRKKFFYGQHVIFSLHFHSFVFIGFLFIMLLNLLPLEGVTWLIILAFLSIFGIFGYLAAALKGAYGGSTGSSILKAFGVSVLYVIIIIVCLLVIAAITFWSA